MFRAKETGLFCLLSSCLRLIADGAASSSSPHPPVLLGLPPHGWCRGVLHLAPSIAAPRYIAGRFAFRHDALCAERADELKHDGPPDFKVLKTLNRCENCRDDG